MQIQLNGEPYACEQNTTLLLLLQQMHMEPKTVVAELCGNIVQAENFPQTVLHESDTLELLRFVGGG